MVDASWMAMKAGEPSAATAVNFARGYFAEGFVVSALKRMAEKNPEEFVVQGCSPELVFSAEPDLEAHPDVLLWWLEKDETELVQIKCPSIFSPIWKDDPLTAGERYLPQVALEMYIGNKQGYDIKRSHLFIVSLEAPRGKVQTVCITIEYNSTVEGIVEQNIQEVRDDLAQAEQGIMPDPFPVEQAGKYPCSFCSFSRVGSEHSPQCDNHAAWLQPQAAAV